MYHSLLKCDHKKQFWVVAEEQFGLSMPRLHPKSGAMDIIDGTKLQKKETPLAVTVMWTIWSSRNNFVHGENVYQPLKKLKLVEEHMSTLELPVQGEKLMHVLQVGDGQYLWFSEC